MVQKRATRKPRDNAVEDVYFGTRKTNPSFGSQGDDAESVRHGSLQPRPKVRRPNVARSASAGAPPSSNEFTQSLIKSESSMGLDNYVPAGLPQDPELQAICFFMTKFVQDSRQEEIWGGCLEALAPLYNETGPDSALAMATTATSMGSIAWNPACADFKPVSISKYVASLKQINAAVKDPRESKSDQVLMAVLMLGFYEVSVWCICRE